MKKEFTAPEVELYSFDAADVIATSGNDPIIPDPINPDEGSGMD